MSRRSLPSFFFARASTSTVLSPCHGTQLPRQICHCAHNTMTSNHKKLWPKKKPKNLTPPPSLQSLPKIDHNFQATNGCSLSQCPQAHAVHNCGTSKVKPSFNSSKTFSPALNLGPCPFTLFLCFFGSGTAEASRQNTERQHVAGNSVTLQRRDCEKKQLEFHKASNPYHCLIQLLKKKKDCHTHATSHA